MDQKLTLYIGDKNLSSWSLRPWMVLTEAGAKFEEVIVRLNQPDTRANILKKSPSGRVPALHHGERLIWDSLSICEYANELFPAKELWPEDAGARAWARSISAEMHSGYQNLRSEMSMNIMARTPKAPNSAVKQDIDRIVEIWHTTRARFAKDGNLLFGRFTIADAMFAPVVTRFVTYDVKVDAEARKYMDSVLALPSMKRWIEAAKAEVAG